MNIFKNSVSVLGLVLLFMGGLVLAQQDFSDVASSHPHATAITYVKAAGIVEGYSDGTFRPDADVNRVELLKILQETEFLKIFMFLSIVNKKHRSFTL